MTSINRLTTKPNLEDLDFIPIWDSTAGRTRNIQAESIKTFISDLIPDNDPVVGGSINEGQLTLHTKSGQDIEVGSAFGLYDGEGFGVPVRTETGHGTIIQTSITGNYRNTSNEVGDLTINLRTDEGIKNFRFYYSVPYGTLLAREVYVKVDENTGINKKIRAGETWQCEVKTGGLSDDFFWSKVNDGESVFEAIDVSGFDVDHLEIKPLLKRFTDTDLVTIPLTLPEGFSVLVRQVLVKRPSGIEMEMEFTYKYDGAELKVNLDGRGTGFLLAGIIKGEI
jgi:hypothetical protein